MVQRSNFQPGTGKHVEPHMGSEEECVDRSEYLTARWQVCYLGGSTASSRSFHRVLHMLKMCCS